MSIARWARKAGVSVLGFALLVAGLVMLVLPGPGWLVIFAGLGVLAIEYAWARVALERARERVRKVTRRRKKADREDRR